MTVETNLRQVILDRADNLHHRRRRSFFVIGVIVLILCAITTYYFVSIGLKSEENVKRVLTFQADKLEEMILSNVIIDKSSKSLKLSGNGVTYIDSWESKESNKAFSGPFGIAFDKEDNAYVVDSQANMIKKLSISGNLITSWGGTKGNGAGQFNYPRYLALDSAANVYVADSYNNRIQKFTKDGQFIAKWGIEGDRDGDFNGPFGIAVDQFDNVYVADSYNNRIQKFTKDGQFIKKWGSAGNGPGQLSTPRGMAFDLLNNLYVVDSQNNRIVKFTADGTYLTHWGSGGAENGQFKGAFGITIDRENNVFVVDTNNFRIQKFKNDGTFLAKWGAYGASDEGFRHPYGAAVDSKNNLYITDGENFRIQVYDTNAKFGSAKTLLIDTGKEGTATNRISWRTTKDVPAGTSIRAIVRTAEKIEDLPGVEWSTPLRANGGKVFYDENRLVAVKGRFVEVKLVIDSDNPKAKSPEINRLTIMLDNCSQKISWFSRMKSAFMLGYALKIKKVNGEKEINIESVKKAGQGNLQDKSTYNIANLCLDKALGDLPRIETRSGGEIKAMEAVIPLYLSDIGGSSDKTVRYGIEYSSFDEKQENDGGLIHVTRSAEAKSVGLQEVTIKDLLPDTRYYYRAWISNKYGTTYGIVQNFKTPIPTGGTTVDTSDQ